MELSGRREESRERPVDIRHAPLEADHGLLQRGDLVFEPSEDGSSVELTLQVVQPGGPLGARRPPAAVTRESADEKEHEGNDQQPFQPFYEQAEAPKNQRQHEKQND